MLKAQAQTLNIHIQYVIEKSVMSFHWQKSLVLHFSHAADSKKGDSLLEEAVVFGSVRHMQEHVHSFPFATVHIHTHMFSEHRKGSQLVCVGPLIWRDHML